MAAVLLMGLGSAAARAEELDSDSKSNANKSSFWSGWFGDKPKPAAKTKPISTDEKPAPRAVDLAGAEQKRQMNAALRRAEVCLRLRQIALDTGNEDLQRLADELEERAWAIYRQKTANLPITAQPLNAEMQTMGEIPAKKVMERSEANLEGERP
jgi:hypothetical protein